MDRILTELDICFGECHYAAGEFPFEEGGWREEGIPSAMVVRFCQRQTEQDNPTTCAIFHNEREIFEYHLPEATCDSAHVVFVAQESHCFFYRKGT